MKLVCLLGVVVLVVHFAPQTFASALERKHHHHGIGQHHLMPSHLRNGTRVRDGKKSLALEERRLVHDLEHMLKGHVHHRRTLASALEEDDVVLSQLSADALEVEAMKPFLYKVYITLLRLRRFMYFMPKELANFNIDRNILASCSMTGINAVASFVAPVTSTVVSFLSGRIVSYITDTSSTAAAIGYAYYLDQTNPEMYMALRKGEFVPPGGFTDTSLKDFFTAYMAFLAHRKVGEWDTGLIEETRQQMTLNPVFRNAAQIHAAAQSKYNTALGWIASTIGIILVVVPEPVTTAAGIGLLFAASGHSTATSITSTASGNLAQSRKLGMLTLIIITFFAFEYGAEVGVVNSQVCSIVASDNMGCQSGQVCQRELLISHRAEEGNLENRYGGREDVANESGKKGFCADDLSRLSGQSLNSFGNPCQLHRECSSGYCHFASAGLSSTELWTDFDDHSTGSDDLPEQTAFHLLEMGFCAVAVGIDDRAACEGVDERGATYTAISSHHKFAACVPAFIKTSESIEETVSGDAVRYGDQVLIASKVIPETKMRSFLFAKSGYTIFYPVMKHPSIGRTTMGIALKKSEMKDVFGLVTRKYSTASPVVFDPVRCTSMVEERGKMVCKEWIINNAVNHSPIRFGDFVTVTVQTPTNAERNALNNNEVDIERPLASRYLALYTHQNVVTSGSAYLSLQYWKRESYVRIDPRMIFKVRTKTSKKDLLSASTRTELSLEGKFVLESVSYPNHFVSFVDEEGLDVSGHGERGPQQDKYSLFLRERSNSMLEDVGMGPVPSVYDEPY